MKPEEFVKQVRRQVYEAAVQDTMSLLEEPPGRSPDPKLVKLSKSYGALPNEDRERVRGAAALAADIAVFHILTVLDGVYSLVDDEGRGSFELYYCEGEEKTLINSPDSEELHDLFVAERDA